MSRRELYLKKLAPFFSGVTIRNVQTQHCERWAIERGAKIATLAMACALSTMRALTQ